MAPLFPSPRFRGVSLSAVKHPQAHFPVPRMQRSRRPRGFIEETELAQCKALPGLGGGMTLAPLRHGGFPEAL
jgi:hypothetical protein